MEAGVSLSQPSMDGILDTIAKEGCGSLLEEVFLDLEVGALLCRFISRLEMGLPSHEPSSPRVPRGADSRLDLAHF